MKCASCGASLTGEICLYCGTVAERPVSPADIAMLTESFATAFLASTQRREWLEMLEQNVPATLTWRLHEATGKSLAAADAALAEMFKNLDLSGEWEAAKRHPSNLAEIRRREEFLAFKRTITKK